MMLISIVEDNLIYFIFQNLKQNYANARLDLKLLVYEMMPIVYCNQLNLLLEAITFKEHMK